MAMHHLTATGQAIIIMYDVIIIGYNTGGKVGMSGRESSLSPPSAYETLIDVLIDRGGGAYST